jgi:predicted ATPase/DNA-binding CsgD family transcriptional regulator/Tfp pilus assembly protein PilF
VITAFLAEKSALIVLDNCEHLESGPARFSRHVLERCPDVAVLSTSRQPLGAPSEVQWSVAGMSDQDSVELFANRAGHVVPGFAVTPTNADAISEICRRVDELPLAIELAAARSAVMSGSEILHNLDRRLGFLSSTDRTAPARQQTITATIDWSYQLLTADEARLFARLSVFRGGFDLEAAETVCGDQLATPAIDLLSSLVLKSMVVRVQPDGESSRYRLLDLQAVFAEEQLREFGEAHELRGRHHDYFEGRITTMTNPVYNSVIAGDVIAEHRWKRREAGNLWAALRWGRENAYDLGLGLAIEIMSAHVGEADDPAGVLANILDRSPATGVLRARGFSQLAWMAIERGDFEAAKTLAPRALELAQEAGWVEGVTLDYNMIGMYHQDRGDFDTAAHHYEAAIANVDRQTNTRLYADMLNSLGILRSLSGEHRSSRELLEEAIAVARANEDPWSLSAFLDSIGWPLMSLGEVEQAAMSWREALTIGRELSDAWSMFTCLQGLASVAAVRGQDRRAVRLAAAAERMAREWSFRNDRWAEQRVNSDVLGSRARLGEQLAEAAWREGSSLDDDRAVDYALSEAGLESMLDPGPLSKREVEVARLVARGATNREIAEALFLSERGAEGHVERIRNKLGVHSRAEVAAWAVSHGLADTEKEKEAPAGTPSSRTLKPHRS